MLKGLVSIDLLPFLIAFALTAAAGPIFIPWLHKLKFGQEIREEGPKWHQKKSGTPTMGGIMFIAGIGIAMIAVTLIAYFQGTLSTEIAKGILIFAVALGFGIVGFIDDYIKVVKKRNLGLTAIQKFGLQLLMTAIYVVVSYFMNTLHTHVFIPFINLSVELPMWIYIPFIMFVMVGVVNAVNLTDGLDGLASSVTLVEAAFFVVMSLFCFSEVGVSMFAAALMGAMAGFLIFNHYPAKVFMGDTGSLFLGGAVALMAIDLGIEIFLIIVGFVYFAETLSVIIQTSYFKYTKKKYGEGRRVFKMTPIHHHFEMCGWNEKKIVAVFSLVTLVLCVVMLMFSTGFFGMTPHMG